MDYSMKEQTVDIINNNILTPIIYMLEDDYGIDFICFCDMKIDMKVIYDTERQLSDLTGREVSVIDIREFCEAERLEIIRDAEIVYSENQNMEKFVVFSVADEFRRFSEEKEDAVRRYNEYGTAYAM